MENAGPAARLEPFPGTMGTDGACEEDAVAEVPSFAGSPKACSSLRLKPLADAGLAEAGGCGARGQPAGAPPFGTTTTGAPVDDDATIASLVDSCILSGIIVDLEEPSTEALSRTRCVPRACAGVPGGDELRCRMLLRQGHRRTSTLRTMCSRRSNSPSRSPTVRHTSLKPWARSSMALVTGTMRSAAALVVASSRCSAIARFSNTSDLTAASSLTSLPTSSRRSALASRNPCSKSPMRAPSDPRTTPSTLPASFSACSRKLLLCASSVR
mmetsp:Transcript_24569/g.68386  ORF Transcript_24569/g.68386 Transcript_24569/m.68386 type:complete len:270 (-) Transcript_24569:612-1421(-)